jgi:putative methanogenesis marker 16 metalloprotein
MKTLEAINRKIQEGSAKVWAACEFKERVRSGETVTARDVDVVTCGTFGVMSGTMAALSIPVSPGGFVRAEQVWLNGVPAYPGPCPNENLGIIDVIVFGTAHAGRKYGGGHLFRDIVSGKSIEVVVQAEGREFVSSVRLPDLGFARIITTRSAFKNYYACVNPNRSVIHTIFSVTGLSGPCTEATFSGCGEINPLQNDPSLRTIGPGTRILVNGGIGYVMGTGTRSTPGRPNLSVYADMAGMVPELMGGFVTSAGPECLASFAVPVPVLDDRSVADLSILNEHIPLPVTSIADRTTVLGMGTYGGVWNETDHIIRFDPSACIKCESCRAWEICPTGAITAGNGIDPAFCVHCGTCVAVCPGGAFIGRLGTVPVEDQQVPVTLRQSNIHAAERLCQELKDRIITGRFTLTGPEKGP